MTRRAVNGSPALADRRRVDGRVRQAGRRRAQRAQADGRGGRVGHGRWISDWTLGIAESSAAAPVAVQPPARARQANEPSPAPDPALQPIWGILRRCRTAVRRRRAAARGRPSPPHEPDATDGHRPDPDRTDHRPRAAERDLPHARSLPGSDVTGGRPRTPGGAHRRDRRARVGRDVQRRDRGRPARDACWRAPTGTTPNPASARVRADRVRPHQGSLGHDPPAIRRPGRARRPGSSSTAPSTA